MMVHYICIIRTKVNHQTFYFCGVNMTVKRYNISINLNIKFKLDTIYCQLRLSLSKILYRYFNIINYSIVHNSIQNAIPLDDNNYSVYLSLISIHFFGSKYLLFLIIFCIFLKMYLTSSANRLSESKSWPWLNTWCVQQVAKIINKIVFALLFEVFSIYIQQDTKRILNHKSRSLEAVIIYCIVLYFNYHYQIL